MGRIPKYMHFKPRNLARVKINGRVIYLGEYDSPESHAKYDRLIAEYLLTREAPQPATDAGEPAITVAGLSEAYVLYALDYYGDHRDSQAHRARSVLRDVCELYGDLPAVDFRPLKLRAVIQKWESGLCRKTINDKLWIVKDCFRWAVANEKLPPTTSLALDRVNRLKKGRTKAKDSRKILPVADEIVERTRVHLPQVLQDMIRFQRLTGARPGEVCQLRPCDVERSGDVWWYLPKKHKTEHLDQERCIAIGPAAQEVLLPYLLRDKQAPCFSPQEAIEQRMEVQHAQRQTPMSCGNTPSGRRDARVRPYYTPDSYRRAIHRVCDREKIPRWSPNQLRHTRATEVRQELGYEAARTVLGHATDITQIYAERNKDLAAEAALRSG